MIAPFLACPDRGNPLELSIPVKNRATKGRLKQAPLVRTQRLRRCDDGAKRRTRVLASARQHVACQEFNGRRVCLNYVRIKLTQGTHVGRRRFLGQVVRGHHQHLLGKILPPVRTAAHPNRYNHITANPSPPISGTIPCPNQLTPSECFFPTDCGQILLHCQWRTGCTTRISSKRCASFCRVDLRGGISNGRLVYHWEIGQKFPRPLRTQL